MVDPKNNNNSNNSDLIEALKTEEENEEITSRSQNLELKNKMRKMIFLIIVIVVLLIIVLLLLSLSGSKKNSYSDIEKVMVNAAQKYYNTNSSLLPSADKATSEVSVQKLINGGYMKSLDKYNPKAASCSGKVVVENNDDTYLYVSYLDCGSNYTTTELFREITKSSNIVDSDEGLYKINDEYVFRGENVNNYVKMDENLWRIVKVDKNDDIVLIYDGLYWINHEWDDRYNSELNMNYGYNNYKKSRVKEYLEDIYNASKKGDTTTYTTLLFTNDSIKYLTSYDLCVGKRNDTQTQNNNMYECQDVLENTKVGLLTLSDYINASVDPSCKSSKDSSCQNYNFIATRDSFWLATGTTQNSYGVYEVDRSGVVEAVPAGSYSGIRPVVHLSSKTMFGSGKGTKDSPYLIK